MSGGVPACPRLGSDAFPAPALPGFDPPNWSLSVNGTMHPSDSLKPFASVASSASRAYSIAHRWTPQFRKEFQGLTGYLDDVMCSANGPSTPGLLCHSPLAWTEMLPSSMHKPWAGSHKNHSFGAQYRSGRGVTPLPFILTTFLCTLQPTTSAIRLIRWLQHAILGLWLAATQTGVTPVRHQTISSPHVHRLVRAIGRYASLNRHRGSPL